ncbi:MAG: hypothetical protein V4692_12600, partial [Bdellovibrionota bacterium]
MRLVLENKDGKAVRTFNVQTSSAVVISRAETKRLEVHASTEALDLQKVRYTKLADVTMSGLEAKPLKIADGTLRVVGQIKDVVRNTQPVQESDDQWKATLKKASIGQGVAVAILLLIAFIGTEKKTEEIQQIVQIVKRIETPKPQPRPKVVERKQAVKHKTVARTPRAVVKKTKVASVKRMGALSVFGSLSNSKQRGGVNLGAVNSSAGPGLGGTGGSASAGGSATLQG